MNERFSTCARLHAILPYLYLHHPHSSVTINVPKSKAHKLTAAKDLEMNGSSLVVRPYVMCGCQPGCVPLFCGARVSSSAVFSLLTGSPASRLTSGDAARGMGRQDAWRTGLHLCLCSGANDLLPLPSAATLSCALLQLLRKVISNYSDACFFLLCGAVQASCSVAVSRHGSTVHHAMSRPTCQGHHYVASPGYDCSAR